MAEPQHDACAAPDEGAARLRALQDQGAAQCLPVRLRHAEQLAQRAQSSAPGPLRDALRARRDAALTDIEARLAQAQHRAREAVAQAAARSPAQARALRRLLAAQDYLQVPREAARQQFSDGAAPLAQLNAQLRTRGRNPQQGMPPASASPGEMASVRRFREGWLRQSAQEQVAQAAQRQPVQAGPLNSQVLALRSLAWMRELSPDYLWRFLAQADTWLWLEQASQQLTLDRKSTAQRAMRVRKKEPRPGPG